MYNRNEVIDLVKLEARKYPSIAHAADIMGISRSHLSGILNRDRGFGPKVLSRLGLREVKMYEVVK